MPPDTEAPALRAQEALAQRLPLSPWLTAKDMDWSELLADHTPELVPKGTVLYRQGDPAREFFLILHGRALLECCHSNGKTRTIYTLTDGMTVGEAGCLFGGVREYDAITATECQVCRIPAEEFHRKVYDSPALAVQVLSIAARKGQVLARLLTLDNFLDSRARLAQALLYLAEQYSRPLDGGVLITLHFTHQDMADFLGISRVSVTQSFRELTDTGLVSKRDSHCFLPSIVALEERLRWTNPARPLA